ncbi:MAG: 1-phosphofructokinase [Lachnospiraceae bacterium]|nr:1-phosphofructokinase [Lachnospiraceae bacterium]
MIYTVTFNPSLDYIVSVEDFQLGKTNRTSSELILPGGKGLNVSTVLKNLGVENTALGFIAGFTGDEIEWRIGGMGVQTDFIRIREGMSRINLKLRSIEGTELNGAGPEIPKEKLRLLMDKLWKLKSGDILCLSGSVPSSLSSTIYCDIMAALADRGILIVVDATKDLLVNTLVYHPFLIKPNHDELGEIFQTEITTKDQAVEYGKKLQDMGARNVMVSMAGKGAVLVAENGQVFQADAPSGTLVNGVGAGDSMVAGFLTGWLKQQDYGHAFRLAVAAGSASAFSKYLATRSEVEEVYQRVNIRNVSESEFAE